MPRLDNWSVMQSAYEAPEVVQARLQGIVTGHHRKRDGTRVLTSPIVGVEGGVKDGCVRTQSGTLYELGEVAPDYETAFPLARVRLWESYARSELFARLTEERT